MTDRGNAREYSEPVFTRRESGWTPGPQVSVDWGIMLKPFIGESGPKIPDWGQLWPRGTGN